LEKRGKGRFLWILNLLNNPPSSPFAKGGCYKKDSGQARMAEESNPVTKTAKVLI
jgi:hypothetical protein